MNPRRQRIRSLPVMLLGLLLGLASPPGARADPFAAAEFRAVWWRADQLVHEGGVARTWLWGPEAGYTTYEAYAESPGGQRLVQYFDKSRMEITNPAARRDSWYVTNGLLVREMATGRLQTGDNQFVATGRLVLPVAGDLDRNPHMPTYADFGRYDPVLADQVRQPERRGQAVSAFWDPSLQSGPLERPALAQTYPETAAAFYDPVTAVNVPGVFWRYLHQAGDVLEGNRRVRVAPFFDWLYVMGRPISAAYWTRGLVSGVEKDVLVQLFERRVLTYTPSNAAGWQVEMGNVGQHYLRWRYGSAPIQPPELGSWQPLYRRGGTLYRLDLARGTTTTLLTLPAGADQLALSGRFALAYTAGDTLYVADPVAGTSRAVYQAAGRAGPTWNIGWSSDGLALAYVLAYDDEHGSRVVELGTFDGSAQRVVTTIEGRAGPPPMTGPAPGFTQLQILGYSRDAGQIWVTPVGGTAQFKSVWSIAVATGVPATVMTFDDPSSLREMVSSADLALLAVSRAPDRLIVRSLVVPQTSPREFRVPGSATALQLRWSPDSRYVAFLTQETSGDRAFVRLRAFDLRAETAVQSWGDTTVDAALYGWHPDGRTLALRWFDSALQRQRHGLVNLATGAVTPLELGPDARLIGWLPAR